jgi:hypothetical protein
MKQKIQLFINNQEVDVFQNGSINIQSSIKDVKEPGKIFTDFSRNFSLPASKTNNKIFKHYYNYNISDGFDARKTVEARIEINNRVFRDGYIMLEGVDLKYNKPYSYRVTFYGNLRLLNDLFSNSKLSELSWLDAFSITYRAVDTSGTDSIKDYLTTSKNFTVDSITYNQPVVVPLITHSDRLYYDSGPDYYGILADGNLFSDGTYPAGSPAKYNGVDWQQLKPAVRVDLIIKAIEKFMSSQLSDNDTNIDINFSTDFFNSTNLDYYNLYMWLHQKEGAIQTEKVNTLINTFDIGTIQKYFTNSSQLAYTAKFFSDDGQTSGSFGNKLKITIENDKVDSVIGELSLVSSDTSTEFDLTVKRNGATWKTFTKQTSTGVGSYLGMDFDDGDYEFIITTTAANNITFSVFNLKLIARIEQDYGVSVDDVVRSADTITTPQQTNFKIQDNFPDMTILEFMSGIFKMFNLVAEVRNDSPTQKTVVVKTLDDFYTSSIVETDITSKIDISSSKVEKSLPYTKINFEYQDTGSLLAKEHKEANNITWGGEGYEVGDKRYESVYGIKPGFGHMKFEKLKDNSTGNFTDIQVGFSVTRSNDDVEVGTQERYNPYIGKPVLFYPILLSSPSETIPYVYNNRGSYSPLSTYFIPSNAVSTDISKTNHFGEELNEYDADISNSQTYSENLYSLYYENYIRSVFNPKKRLIKLNGVFSNSFTSNFSLADTMVVSGEKYNINKINLDIVTGKASLELISTYATASYLCLPSLLQVRIETITGGYLYIFDNKYGVYQVASGTYTFSDVPSSHPIAFYNNGKESLISYTGTVNGGTKTGQDGNTYTYYSGDITVTVNGDFGTISYECYHHGYMGGENNLTYNSDCSVAPTPTPTPGTLTVDSTLYSTDNTNLTADQTDE